MNEIQADSSSSIPELRNPLAELFQALHNAPQYSTQTMKTQLVVWFGVYKVGGLNYAHWHFYISKIFARNHGSDELLHDHGFEWIKHSATHQYWKLEGIQHHQLFKAVIEEMTGCPINVR